MFLIAYCVTAIRMYLSFNLFSFYNYKNVKMKVARN